MEARLKTVVSLLKEHTLDAILISSSETIHYLTGFTGFSETERDGYLLITKKTNYILTSPLYKDAINKASPQFSCLIYTHANPLNILLKQVTKKHSLKRVGFDPHTITVNEWSYLKKDLPALTPISLSTLRIKKDVQEIAAVKKAAHIADDAVAIVLPQIKPGMTEMQVQKLVDAEIRNHGEPAFRTIVAFGANAALPHHVSSKTKLLSNDLLLIDFGATYKGYRSDMTRTYFYGKIPAVQKRAYHAVHASQQHAVEFIKKKLEDEASISAADVDAVARNYLISEGYPSIPHSLGHGIGLVVHEAPSLSPRSTDRLTEGMIFSIEPGVYYPGKFGIRIEDLYVITNNTLIRLTKAPLT